MDMQPIEPNRQMHATLTAQQWEAVLGHLDTGQHRIVRPIIDTLMAQLRNQSQSPAQHRRYGRARHPRRIIGGAQCLMD